MNKIIKVYDSDDCFHDYRPEGLIEYIQWLNDKLSLIPEEFRTSATLEINAYESYGTGHYDYVIKYERPETNDERESRELKEQERKNWEKTKKIEIYEALKKELGQ